MKYNGLATIKRLYYFYPLHYIKLFLTSNIKTIFTSPKTIFYSMRYNNGENFMMHNKTLYPYQYKVDSIESSKSSINLAYKLDACIQELTLKKLENENSNITKLYTSKTIETLNNSIDENLIELLKNLRYITSAELDLPAGVLARLLYGGLKAENYLRKTYFKSDEETKLIIELFMKKIRFADSESLALFMSSIADLKVNDSSIWNQCLEKITELSFEPEFTKVTNSSPHLFRYVEVSTNSCKSVSRLSSNVFYEGWRGVFLAYNSIEKAVDMDVKNSRESLSILTKRFKLEDYIKEEKRKLL